MNEQTGDLLPSHSRHHHLPRAEEAEKSLLGAVLIDNAVLERLADMLAPEDFYIGAHQVLYRNMLIMGRSGRPIDFATLHTHLETSKEIESAGGTTYLTRLVETIPTTANVPTYAGIVRDKAILRLLARQATTIAEEIYQGDKSVSDTLDSAEQRIFEVAEKQQQRRLDYQSLKQIIPTMLHRLDDLISRRETITGVGSGFIDLDKLTAGFQPSDLLILAGRPAMGKTALAMNFAANAALMHETPIGIFSLEMSKEQLVMRLISSEARVDASSLRTGYINEQKYSDVIRVASALTEAPLFIDDTPALSVMALRAKARRLKREQNIQLIVVDYLQLMRGNDRSENRTNEISEISRGLKALAKELNIPVLAISQLSRAPEARTDKRPLLSDLRESGSIEQDADVVMFVFREEYYKPDDPALTGVADLIIAKQRNGPQGTVRLQFQHTHTRFENFSYREDA